MSEISALTTEQIVLELKSDSLLNKARAIIRATHGQIEQASAQRKPASSIDIVRMELEAVIKIANLLGVELKPVANAQDGLKSLG